MLCKKVHLSASTAMYMYSHVYRIPLILSIIVMWYAWWLLRVKTTIKMTTIIKKFVKASVVTCIYQLGGS